MQRPFSRPEFLGCLRSLIVVFLACGGTGAWGADTSSQKPQGFQISRGVNISHWLSQSGRRGAERAAYFGEQDVRWLASIGYDHLRLPVDEEQLWNEAGGKEPEAFRLLQQAIGWCRESNLRVVVDLHILRSHHFNAKEKPLWTEAAAQEKFFDLWRQLSAELRRHPVDLLAYELMNEPVADDAEDWNRLIARAIQVVREHEPHRWIVVGSNRWQSAGTFDQLRVPAGDRHLILSFHLYEPFLLTHHRASWTGVKDYTGPVHYPGRLVRPEDLDGLPEAAAQVGRNHNGLWNRDRLQEFIAKPLAVAKELRLPLYCGEWGCITGAPREDRLRWYADLRAVLEANGIAWANWDYQGGFGIRNAAGPDQDLVRILTGD